MKKDKIDGYIQIPKKDSESAKTNIDTTEFLDSLNKISESMKKISEPLIEFHNKIIPYVLEDCSHIGETITNFARNLIEAINIDDIKRITISSNLENILKEFAKALSSFHFGELSEYDSEILKRNFWVIPFEYEFKDVGKLASLSKSQFNKEMISYFTKSRVNRLFNVCIKKEEKNDKKVLLRQIKKNYFSENYSICVTSLITYLDSLTLQFIDESSKFQHLSYKVIDSLHQYYSEEVPFSDGVLDLYLKVEVLKNFYDILYDNNEDLKNANAKTINRNITSHGAKYSNKQIDVLRLINAIWLIQTIVDDSNMKDKFISFKDSKDNNHVKFKKK